jgi:threonine/homoserine/homoserine lactone efflux protein
MDPVWINICSVLIIFTLAIVSPGPNFIMVVHTALTDSRRGGLYTALGVATGSGLFALAGMVGLILVINSFSFFSKIVPICGGSYLVWLGFSILNSVRKQPVSVSSTPIDTAFTLRPVAAYRTGLLTSLTNPKAWAFYFSLFTLVMTPETPLWAKASLNLSMFIISFAWYATVAILITNNRVQPFFIRVQPLFQSILGVLLLWLGGRLLLTIGY